MPWLRPDVFVIRTPDPIVIREWMEVEFGLDFVTEQHGTGPVHYAHETHDKVLEIYPVG
jgi:hypothetical protein